MMGELACATLAIWQQYHAVLPRNTVRARRETVEERHTGVLRRHQKDLCAPANEDKSSE